jgi:hypothetical protein
MKSLLEELYSPSECKTIRSMLLSETDSTKKIILEAVGNKVALDQEKILTSNPIDILYMICLTSKFASSEEECHRIAITVYQRYRETQNFLPMLSKDTGIIFATKTLIALSFHAKALEHRWKYHGAPKPDFYRKISKATFITHGQKDIASHHEQWEGFLGEMFV